MDWNLKTLLDNVYPIFSIDVIEKQKKNVLKKRKEF